MGEDIVSKAFRIYLRLRDLEEGIKEIPRLREELNNLILDMTEEEYARYFKIVYNHILLTKMEELKMMGVKLDED